MTSRNITVTSKNQITLPASYVRDMHLERNRVLQVEIRGKSIVLTPQPDLGDSLRKFWGKHRATRPLTDEEISQAARAAAIARFAKE
jgi:bifunctional DNA-binding transcriptional regulator/antitoxin component of YhaV-PrlF toxin-antitoxin module